MNIDLWYDDVNILDIDGISINFYPSPCEYRGNIYINGRCVGDYIANNSIELEENFSHLKFNW